MATLSSKDSKVREFARHYQADLRRYVMQGTRAKPVAALKLGRKAVKLGIDILELALLHEKAVISQTSLVGVARVRERIIRRACRFFAEVLIPIEETHRQALVSRSRIGQLNVALDRSAKNLLKSKGKLKGEIARRKTIEQELHNSQCHSDFLIKQSRQLSHLILSAQEEERKRISRELHDLVSQTLAGINIYLADLRLQAARNTKGVIANISHTQKLVEDSVEKVHRFALELRPAVLDDLGLIPALKSLLKHFMEDTGVRGSLKVFAGVEALSNSKRTVLYRVAQEALANIGRHANATHSTVNIKKLSKAFRMQIHDDGESFDVDRVLHSQRNKRLGLIGMRERVEMVGGKFIVESTPGTGTTITALIPFRNAVMEPTPA